MIDQIGSGHAASVHAIKQVADAQLQVAKLIEQSVEGTGHEGQTVAASDTTGQNVDTKA